MNKKRARIARIYADGSKRLIREIRVIRALYIK